MRAQVRFSCHPAAYIAESTEAHAPAPFSLASSTAPRSAVRGRALRAVPCGAVLCRALQSVVFRAYQSTTLASIQSWPEPACMSSSILCGCCLRFPLLSFIFHCFLDCNKHPQAGRMQQQTAIPQYVYTSMYVVEPRAQHSAAQSPLHKAANQVRIFL